VREILLAILAGIFVAGILPGCSTSSAEQDTIRQAWADRDAERARECRQVGGFLIAGSCLPRP
jgi:hypothetical protein